MLVVNLFGGPGLGKTTTAVGLVHKLKKFGLKVELATEVIKDHIYGNETKKIQDQLYLLAQQHHKLYLYKDSVDIVVTDAPLLLASLYASERKDPIFDNDEFKNYVKFLNDQYNNLNILLKRNDKYQYQNEGRLHSLEEAKNIDAKIKKLLFTNNARYITIPITKNIQENVLSLVLEAV